MNSFKNTLLQFNRNGMGEGDEELAQLLASNYLKLMLEEDELPQCITFYNGGVKLMMEETQAFPYLKTLHEKGVRLVACTTCLKYFNLLQDLKIGISGTMPDIIALQKAADKVITL